MKRSSLSEGRNEERVRRVLDHYQNQSEEAVAEDEAPGEGVPRSEAQRSDPSERSEARERSEPAKRRAGERESERARERGSERASMGSGGEPPGLLFSHPFQA
jgi:hypothetical protein